MYLMKWGHASVGRWANYKKTEKGDGVEGEYIWMEANAEWASDSADLWRDANDIV